MVLVVGSLLSPPLFLFPLPPSLPQGGEISKREKACDDAGRKDG